MTYDQKFEYVANKIDQSDDFGTASNAVADACRNDWFKGQPRLIENLNTLVRDKFGKGTGIVPMNAKQAAKAIGESAMIKLVGLSKLPTKEYVIKRFELSEGSFGLLCATGNSGKTMLVQYLACCVSSGQPLFGEYEVKKGSVVHVDQEQSQVQTQRRYERLAAGMKLDSLDITRVTLANRLDSKKLNIVDVEKELVEALTGKTLAVIDSLKKTSEVDENSAEIEIILNMFKNVAEKTNCAILLIHHKGKGKDAKQSGRGHSSIYDSVDVQIDLDVTNEIFELACAKNRDGRFFDGIKYQLVDAGAFNAAQNCTERLEFDLLQGDVKSKKLDMRARILEALSTVSQVNHTELYNTVKGDRTAFSELLSALVDSDEVEETKGAKGAKLYSITSKGKAAEAWS